MQTKGLKKLFHEQKFGVKEVRSSNQISDSQSVKSIIKGHKRSHEQVEQDDDDDLPKKPRDYNVVGVDDSSSEEDEESDEVETPQVAKEEKSETKMETAENQADPVKVTEPPKVQQLPSTEEKPVDATKALEPAQSVDRKPSRYVHVDRDADIQIARLKLPILAEEQIIMETISENSVTILAGETGSGKVSSCQIYYILLSITKIKLSPSF